jgi:hypothetical protein
MEADLRLTATVSNSFLHFNHCFFAVGKAFTDQNTQFTGDYAKDTIALANDLQIPGVTFGLLRKGDWPVTALQYDGVLGLTYQTIDGTKSVLQEAADQGLIQQPIFTMYIVKEGHTSEGLYGGKKRQVLSTHNF